MDRCADWLNSIDQSCISLSLTQVQVTKIKSSLILRPTHTPSPFGTVAADVARGIKNLEDLIKSHQKGYISSSVYSNSEKDQIEAEVGLCISTCSKQIDRLKNSAVAAQQHDTTQGRPGISGQASAHLHGVVLVLAESLQRTAASFDELRSQRYRQKANEERQRKQLAYKAPFPYHLGEEHQTRRQDLNPARFTGTASQQQLLADENKSLALHLQSKAQSVLGIEQSAMELATLNQMFSSAISSQVSAIEATFENAMTSSAHIKAGNEHLSKAIIVNRSTQRYILVLLIVATLGLLFFDWFNS